MALTAVLAAAACGSDSGTAPTTGGTGRAGGGDELDVRASIPSGRPLPAEALASLLPAGGDLGEGWTEEPDAQVQPEPGLDAAIERDCPALARIDRADPERDIIGSYRDGERRQLQISINPRALAYSPDDLTAITAAIDRCPPIVYDQGSGAEVVLRVRAAVEEQLGEQAVRVAISGVIETSSLDQPIRANTYLYSFRRGRIGVTLQASDSVDPETGEVTSFEPGPLENVAAYVDEGLVDLVG